MKTPRLNDLQLILLSAAAARESGSLLPFSGTIPEDRGRAGKAVDALLKRKLAEEAPVTDLSLAYRTPEEGALGIFITEAGRRAIGAAGEADEPPESPAEPSRASAEAPPRGSTMAELVLTLLKRGQGATLAELTEATGWLPHTVRAHLTGLRKKGHAIEKSKREDVTCYRLAEAG